MEQALAVETPVHVVALVAYALAAGLVLFGTTMSRPVLVRAGHAVALVGLAIHSVALGLRWYGAGHGPYLTRYEVLSSNAWVTMAFAQGLRFKQRGSEGLAVLIYPAVLLLLGLSIYTGPEVKLLPLTFRGIWLVLHVCFYFVAFAAALLSLGYGTLHIMRGTKLASRMPAIPDAAALDRESYRFAGLTFAFWGIGMLTGAIWAYYSWGRSGLGPGRDVVARHVVRVRYLLARPPVLRHQGPEGGAAARLRIRARRDLALLHLVPHHITAFRVLPLAVSRRSSCVVSL